MKKQFRPFMTIPILIALVLYAVSFSLLRSFKPARWFEGLRFKFLSRQDPSRLNIRDRVLVFERHVEAGREEQAFELVEAVGTLHREDRLWFAGHSGRYLRERRRYALESRLYETLLKETDPVYYHLFRAVSCEAQGDLDCESLELSKARDRAQHDDLSGFINSQLMQHIGEKK